MRRDIGPWDLLGLCACGLFLAGASALALTDDNPYAAIVGRNAFALKPPPRPEDIKAPPPPAPDIKLQGISTILGRKQVIMKVKLQARPPEPAKDLSIMLGEGEREGEVEVLEINANEGVVRVNNGGSPLTLTMTDNSEKPTPGAVPPAGAPGGLPPRLPLPGGVPPPAPAASPMTSPGVTAFGGAGTAPTTPSSAAATLPTRTLRTTTESPQSHLSPEATAAMYIVNQNKNEQLRQSGVLLPKLPRHPLAGGLQNTSGSGDQ